MDKLVKLVRGAAKPLMVGAVVIEFLSTLPQSANAAVAPTGLRLRAGVFTAEGFIEKAITDTAAITAERRG